MKSSTFKDPNARRFAEPTYNIYLKAQANSSVFSTRHLRSFSQYEPYLEPTFTL